MNKDNIKSAGQIRKEKKDLQRLEELMCRIGLDKLDEPTLSAIYIQTYLDFPVGLRTPKGREVYKAALKGIKGTSWESVFEKAPAKDGREVQAFRDAWDEHEQARDEAIELEYAEREERTAIYIEERMKQKENGDAA